MLQQICRTCLATCGELVPIFSNEHYVRNLPDKLLQTTKIEVLKDDALPKMMCKKCIFLVDSLYCFKDQCEMAEIKLKKSLKNKVCNDIYALNNASDSNDKNYHFDEVAEVQSDIMSSSEEEYHIEYVSEEARLEVENARRRSRNAKKKRNNYSELKVKTPEELPTPNFDEEIIISESDDKLSSYNSEELKKLSNNVSKKKVNDDVTITAEKINFFKNEKHKIFQENSTSLNMTMKRKLINNNSCLSKVPKKVMFKENDYNDKDIQFIEITENNVKTNEKSKNEIDLNTEMNFNASQNDSEKLCQKYNILVDKDSNNVNSSINTVSPDDTKKVLELRMQNLMSQIILYIPEVCTICIQFFKTNLDVLKHKIEHHLYSDQGFFFCPICQEKFSTNNKLLDHVNEHSNLKFYSCIICSANFYTEENMRCHICSKKFIRIQTLLNHLAQHIGKKMLICPLCSDNNFNDKNEIQYHINQKHKNNQQEIKFKNETGELNVSEAKMENVKNHIDYPCAYCENSFTTKILLRDHVLTHLSMQQFSCLVCDKMFSTQDERTQHMHYEHMKPMQINDQKKFRCRVCHEILVSRVAYGQHLKEKHWSAKQTSEILQELSESSFNEKINDQLNKSSVTPPASEPVS